MPEVSGPAYRHDPQYARNDLGSEYRAPRYDGGGVGGCVGGGVTVWICVGGAVGVCVGSAVRECVGVTMAERAGVAEAAGFGGLDDELELHPEIAAPATAAAASIP